MAKTNIPEKFKGEVEVFPDGWVYLKVPTINSDPYLSHAKIGNIKIKAKTGSSYWNTLLWAFGDKTYFITIPAKVRKKEKIEIGKVIEVEFELR